MPLMTGNFTDVAEIVAKTYWYDHTQSYLKVTNTGSFPIIVEVSDEIEQIDTGKSYTFNEEFKKFTVKCKTKKNYSSTFSVEVDSYKNDIANLSNFSPNVFKPLFGNNFDQVHSSEWDQVNDINNLRNKIQKSLYYKMDGCWIAIEVQPIRADRIAFEAGTITEEELVLTSFPSLTYLIDIINEVKANDMQIFGIKVHNKWIRDNWSLFTPSVILDKYKTYLNQIMDIAEGNTTRISILNESKVIYNDEVAQPLIVDLLQTIKGRNFKCSISGSNGSNLTESIISEMDFLAMHSYVPISSKRQATTIEDSITAWNLSGIKERINAWNLKYPNQEIWLVESGVMNYWECLVNPEIYITTSQGTVSANNEVQRIYWEGCFEYLKDCTNLMGVCCWYLDYSQEYPLMLNLMKKYRGGLF